MTHGIIISYYSLKNDIYYIVHKEVIALFNIVSSMIIDTLCEIW